MPDRRRVEAPDARGAVVSPFTFGIGVVHEPSEAGAVACGGPLQHLLIAVGVTKSEYRPPADHAIDAGRLAGAVVDELDFRQLEQYRLPVGGQRESGLSRGADHLLGRNAVGAFGPHAHELDAAA